MTDGAEYKPKQESNETNTTSRKVSDYTGRERRLAKTPTLGRTPLLRIPESGPLLNTPMNLNTKLSFSASKFREPLTKRVSNEATLESTDHMLTSEQQTLDASLTAEPQHDEPSDPNQENLT